MVVAAAIDNRFSHMALDSSPPVALTIAGSDNSAGAGIQADLKTFSAFRVYGLTAVTTVVAEIPGQVKSASPVPTELIRDQITLSLDHFPVGAMKTGMLWSTEIITAVEQILSARIPGTLPPLVIDPVMVASSGDPLLESEAVSAYTERLFPLATLITPNLNEAEVLLQRKIHSSSELEAAGKELAARYNVSFLMKGGHLRGETALDLLVHPDGTLERYEAPFNPSVTTHGTGCTYSAAITAGLAGGSSLSEAVRRGKEYVTASINRAFRWEGIAALNHLDAAR